jgi:prepilin-type N-terminal cleavage/methylation domain-containing protein
LSERIARARDGGWTLLELMAVVLILGILIGIAVATYDVSVDRSQRVACQSNQHILNTAVSAYEEDHDGAVPPDLAALAKYVNKRGAYDVCPADPSVHYHYETTSGRITCPLHPAQ